HVHARDLRRALQRRTLAVDAQLGSDLVELPLERPGEVANREVDPRMNGVEVPDTGRGNGQNRRTHRLFCSFRPSEALGYTCGCKHSTEWLVAYASTFEIRRRWSPRSACGS